MAANALVNFGVADRQLSNKEKWISFFGLFLFGFSNVFNLLKPSAFLGDLGAIFNMGMESVGNLMGVFAFATLILAFPGAWLMRNIGIKTSLLITMIITIIGSILGILAPNGDVLLFSRVLEGVGFGLIAVIGPNIMPRLFELSKQGLVMGIWSQWVPVGTVIVFFLAPILYTAFGWQSLWVVSIALELIALVWLFTGVKFSKTPENVLALGGGEGRKHVVKGKVYLVGAIAVSVIFTLWTFVYLDDINGFYPTFLQEVKGWDIQAAAMPTLVLAAITIPAGILAGMIMGKTRTCKWFVAGGYALVCISVLVGYTAAGDNVSPWILAVLMGFAGGAVPTATRSIIPMLAKDPTKTDYALAVMAFTTGFGQLFSGVYGASVASIGWFDTAYFVLFPCAAVAVVATILFVKSDHAVAKEDALLPDPEEHVAARN
ncbi:MAG: MFS transporter [Coriobacteriales bacterium]|jgi:MFS family permease|nr:MFS transporter [Coriobacteriales bacterium]